MKKITIFLLGIISTVFTLEAQNWMPDNYDGIPQSQKERIFVDNFDDNNYFWVKNSSSISTQIQDGYFFFGNDFDFPSSDGKPINFDPYRNFELEARIKFVSGDVEEFSGLFLGELIFGDKYVFSFSSIGYYQITKDVGFQTNDILRPEKSEIVNRTAENTFTIRMVDENYYFFLNKNLVLTMPYEELPGRYIGFQVAKKSLIQINFLRLWYLNNPDNQ